MARISLWVMVPKAFSPKKKWMDITIISIHLKDNGWLCGFREDIELRDFFTVGFKVCLRQQSLKKTTRNIVVVRQKVRKRQI